MSATLKKCQVVVLVKALPRPSRKYGETVCCAGVTVNREWRRLYPVRFRNLVDDQQFRRWQWVEFAHRPPTQDRRIESCHVYEETIVAGQLLSANQRFGPLDPMVVASASEAHRRGASLGLVRPRNTKFRFRRKPEAALQAEQEAYRNAGRQQSFLDEELTAFKPSTYEFVFAFEDADGRHAWRCGDWETHATFFKWRREYGELEALQRLAGK